MPRQHPNPGMTIPVTLALYQKLLSASVSLHFAKEDWEIAAEAIDEWLRRHAPDTIPMPVAKGYQWKRLFLPDGTLLRTVFDGKSHHCMVEGDQILNNGKAVSPSGFVNAVGGIRRNAWRCTWLLLPGEKEWKLADTLRTRARPRRARKQPTDSPQIVMNRPETDRAPASAPSMADPMPARAEPVAESAYGEPYPQPSHHSEHQHRDSDSGDPGRPRSVSTTHAPPRVRRGADRRTGTQGWRSQSLRDELLPFLLRMFAQDEERRRTRDWQPASAGSQ